jgi:hypothetical protein
MQKFNQAGFLLTIVVLLAATLSAQTSASTPEEARNAQEFR